MRKVCIMGNIYDPDGTCFWEITGGRRSGSITLTLDNIITDGGNDQSSLTIDNVFTGGHNQQPSLTIDEAFTMGGADRQALTIDNAFTGPLLTIGGKHNNKQRNISGVITGGASECAFYLGDIKVCSSPETQQALRELLAEHASDYDKSSSSPDNQPIELVYERLLAVLKCKTESELLNHPAVIKKIGYHKARTEKETRLKPYGPKDHTWFNNDNIDKVLDQWRLTFPGFYNFQFHMIDFARLNKPLATITPQEIRDRGYNCYGCVMNTDKYSGNGEHWMALFVDFRECQTGKCRTEAKIIADPVTEDDLINVGIGSTGASDKTGSGGQIVGAGRIGRSDSHSGGRVQAITISHGSVEFFNSSGNSPVKEIRAWLDTTERHLRTFCRTVDRRVNEVEHQQSDTECGPYSMYYIWNRLNGKSPDELMRSRIPDSVVYKFRDELFRDYK